MTAIHFDQRFRAGANDIEITSLRVSQRHEIRVRDSGFNVRNTR